MCENTFTSESLRIVISKFGDFAHFLRVGKRKMPDIQPPLRTHFQARITQTIGWNIFGKCFRIFMHRYFHSIFLYFFSFVFTKEEKEKCFTNWDGSFCKCVVFCTKKSNWVIHCEKIGIRFLWKHVMISVFFYINNWWIEENENVFSEIISPQCGSSTNLRFLQRKT